MFQKRTNELFLENTEIVFSEMSKLNNKEVSSIWRFLMDGPHINDVQHQKGINQILDKFGSNVEMRSIILEELEDLKLESDH